MKGCALSSVLLSEGQPSFSRIRTTITTIRTRTAAPNLRVIIFSADLANSCKKILDS